MNIGGDGDTSTSSGGAASIQPKQTLQVVVLQLASAVFELKVFGLEMMSVYGP